MLKYLQKILIHDLSIQPNGYELTAALFIRLLAIIFFSAFASLSVQIEGLAGSQGILPLSQALDNSLTYWGSDAFWHFPTLFWLNASDQLLIASTYAGCFVSLLLFFNILPRTSLVILLMLYLSLSTAGQVFMNFQWDSLLMESGFLALFLSPRSRYPIWLFRWLLFRLRFLSGISKLMTQDPSWSGLTAVGLYFEVQPLPNWLAWYAHLLPEWVLMLGTALTLFIEILVPFMMFMPRRYRFVAAWLTISLQVLIIITSNHNWINFLTIALCLFLFDDKALRSILPAKMEHWLLSKSLPFARQTKYYAHSMLLLGSFIFFIGSVQIYEMLKYESVEGRIGQITRQVTTFRLVNQYHVFPTMKTARLELLIYGSDDGKIWQEYLFKYKPDLLDKKPQIIIPHQPRLDWLMWFVTSSPRFMPWFENFLHSLLTGTPAVLQLLAHNPFADKPPRYLRVDLYRYQFTDMATRKQSGHWWSREYLGPFPPLPFMSSADKP